MPTFEPLLTLAAFIGVGTGRGRLALPTRIHTGLEDIVCGLGSQRCTPERRLQLGTGLLCYENVVSLALS